MSLLRYNILRNAPEKLLEDVYVRQKKNLKNTFWMINSPNKRTDILFQINTHNMNQKMLIS